MVRFFKQVRRAFGDFVKGQRLEEKKQRRLGLPSEDEKKEVIDLMAKLGSSEALDYLYMLESFIAAEGHLTAHSFRELLSREEMEISEEEAVQTLELFTSLGFAERHYTEGMEPLYEHVRPGGHHDHISCRSCGKLVEFKRDDVDNLIERIACENGFIHLDHRLVIQGICPKCRKMRHIGLPLTNALPGEQLLVLRISGDAQMASKLSAMGLRKGVRLEVTGEQSGSVVAMIDGVRLALGPDMAENVIVSEINTCLRRKCLSKRKRHCPKH